MSNYSMYPDEPVSIVRQQTFAAKPVLSLADPSTGEDPAKIYSKFSRINLTILGTVNGKKEFVSSNLDLSSLEEIKENTHLCKQEEFNRKIHPSAAPSAASSPAYTVAFAMGPLKGKTPAQVIAEQGAEAGGKTLNGQFTFLKNNLEKHPANQKIMDAITDAGNLMKTGSLKTTNAAPSAAGRADIYPSALKGNIHKEHPEAKGNYFCHDTKIEWQFGNNYPVVITISNFYAPIQKDAQTGKIQVMSMKKLEGSEKKKEIRLTSAEWLHALSMIDKTIWMYETLHMSAIAKSVKAAVDYLRSLADNK